MALRLFLIGLFYLVATHCWPVHLYTYIIRTGGMFFMSPHFYFSLLAFSMLPLQKIISIYPVRSLVSKRCHNIQPHSTIHDWSQSFTYPILHPSLGAETIMSPGKYICGSLTHGNLFLLRRSDYPRRPLPFLIAFDIAYMPSYSFYRNVEARRCLLKSFLHQFQACNFVSIISI